MNMLCFQYHIQQYKTTRFLMTSNEYKVLIMYCLSKSWCIVMWTDIITFQTQLCFKTNHFASHIGRFQVYTPVFVSSFLFVLYASSWGLVRCSIEWLHIGTTGTGWVILSPVYSLRPTQGFLLSRSSSQRSPETITKITTILCNCR